MIIYVVSIEEAKKVIEDDKNQPSLEELFKKREEIDLQISKVFSNMGYPKTIIIK